MADIVALGEPLIEFNQVPGSDTWRQGFGGDTSNFVCAAARVGARAGYLTRVGDDEFGRLLLRLWRDEGVDAGSVVVDPAAPTGLYFVTHGEQGHVFSYRRAGSAACGLTYDATVRNAVRAARHLHVSGISQAISPSACDAVLEALSDARGLGLRTSFDVNFRPRLWPAARARAIAQATLASTELFLPSLDEARLLFGLPDARRLIDWSHRCGARLVAVKCGADGAVVSDGRTITEIPALPVTPVDATGAGDCFGGVLAARLLAGDDLVNAARAACIAAALSTLGYGAVAPLPRWADIAARMPGAAG
ncbi:MAG TPA: sugar kinase [Burkholderiaceae bacterium]|nr:sugar kinase [Burkholderiaceae bacterium]